MASDSVLQTALALSSPEEATRPAFPLGVLHPRGFVRRVDVIGHNYPTPPQATPASWNVGQADLVVLAPTVGECRSAGWLAEAVRGLEGRLAENGLVYVMAPPWWRAAIRRQLKDHGLVEVMALVHLPSWKATHYLVPLDHAAVRYASSVLLPTPRWKRGLAESVLGLPQGGPFLASVLPSVGLVLRRSNDRPLLDWLRTADSGVCQISSMVLSTSQRRGRESVVIHCLGESARLTAVAKLVWDRGVTGSGLDEPSLIARLGPKAQEGGARVPAVRRTESIGGSSVVLEEVVEGTPAAVILASRPRAATRIVELVADWLGHWNALTIGLSGGSEWIEREVLTPARRILPILEHGPEYLSWLAARCTSLGSRMPLVATHNDLTSWNMLVDPDANAAPLGVVDWAEAREESLPLVDFYYAVTDIALVESPGARRLEALQSWLAPVGSFAPYVRPLLRRLQHQLALTDEVAEICLHACFIGHAANELDRSAPTDPREFGEIASWLASNRGTVWQWLRR